MQRLVALVGDQHIRLFGAKGNDLNVYPAPVNRIEETRRCCFSFFGCCTMLASETNQKHEQVNICQAFHELSPVKNGKDEKTSNR